MRMMSPENGMIVAVRIAQSALPTAVVVRHAADRLIARVAWHDGRRAGRGVLPMQPAATAAAACVLVVPVSPQPDRPGGRGRGG